MDGLTPKIQIPPTTLASVKNDSLGTMIGGVVGGALFLMLVIVIIIMFYLRRRRTFRGDYYTKQYAGTANPEKDSQMNVIQHQIDPYTDYEKIERKLTPNNMFQDYPAADQKSEWQNEDNIKNRYTEGVEIPIDYYEDQKIPNASQYDYYDENEDDLVSHLDGSIISRREWYV